MKSLFLRTVRNKIAPESLLVAKVFRVLFADRDETDFTDEQVFLFLIRQALSPEFKNFNHEQDT